MGLIGGGQPVVLPQAIKNRCNENIYKAYCAATGETQFLAAHERYGFMRPTKNNPEWKTIDKWLHIDMSWYTKETSVFGYQESEYKENTKGNLEYFNQYYQGVLAVEDCPIETGGFHIVPGFHSIIEQWTQSNL